MFWSRFIIALIGSFVVLIVSLVVISITQKDIFLVSPKYYDEEIAYQTTINQLNRTSDRDIKLTQVGQQVYVTLDSLASMSHNTLADTLKLELRRPDNAKLDQDLQFLIPKSGKPSGKPSGQFSNQMSFPKPKQGQWKVSAKWSVNGQDHLWRGALYIN